MSIRSTVGAIGPCTMTPASWSVCACIAKGLPRSSGGCNSFPLPQRHPRKAATHPAHGSRADAWGSIDAASALPFPRNASKLNNHQLELVLRHEVARLIDWQVVLTSPVVPSTVSYEVWQQGNALSNALGHSTHSHPTDT